MRFEPDLGEVRATTRVFPRGEYELQVRDVRGMAYEKDDGTEVGGVRVFLTMVGKVGADGSLSDENEGEDVTPVRLYVHTEGAVRMTKRILMALYGYDNNNEDAFDAEIWKDGEFWIEGDDDPDSNEVAIGDGWKDFVGNHVRATLDVGEYEGAEQQDFRSWQPAS